MTVLHRLLHPTKHEIHLWLLLLLCSALSLADVAEFAMGQPHAPFAVAGQVSLAVFKATVLTAIYIFTKRESLLRIISIFFIAMFVFLSVFNGLSWLFYGFGISHKLAGIVFQTNGKEVVEFIPELTDKFTATFHSIHVAAVLILFIVLWFMVPQIPRKLFTSSVCALSVLGLGYLCFVMATADFGKANHLVYARTIRCVRAHFHNSAHIKKLLAMRRPLPYKESASSANKASRVVVVIGESASRDHLSLYGYSLPTTPRLDTISEGLYIFSNAIASSTSTAENLPRLLTFMTDQPDARAWYEYPTLLQLFKKLGYQTYWLSNQEKTGEMSNLSGILSADADVVKYIGSENSEDNYLYRHDDVLLPELNRTIYLADSLQLTFMHLMGSHFQYHNRFPATQARFSADDVLTRMPKGWLDVEKAKIVANYDNSILFTDSILNEVILYVRKSQKPAVMVYLSDHGENVYDDRDYRGRDPKFVRVPFLIYANAAYRNKNPEIMTDIEGSQTVPFSTSELPQLLLHLTGIRYVAYDSISDPLSKAFHPRPRYVDNRPFTESAVNKDGIIRFRPPDVDSYNVTHD